MFEAAVPYRRTIFVCANTREEGRPACANPGRGGEKLCEHLKNEVKKAGLKGKIRVARTGCLDLCEKGPNIFIYPDNIWLSGIQEQNLPQIWDRIEKTLA